MDLAISVPPEERMRAGSLRRQGWDACRDLDGTRSERSIDDNNPKTLTSGFVIDDDRGDSTLPAGALLSHRHVPGTLRRLNRRVFGETGFGRFVVALVAISRCRSHDGSPFQRTKNSAGLSA